MLTDVAIPEKLSSFEAAVIETQFTRVDTRPRRPGETIADIYADPKFSKSLPWVCYVNGEPVLRHTYDDDGNVVLENVGWLVVPEPTDSVVFRVPLQGGSTGDIIKLVAILALVVAAPYLAPEAIALAGTYSGVILSYNAYQVAVVLTQLGIVLGGTLLINALLPPETPDKIGAPGPTYSIQPAGNVARLDGMIPVQYGDHMIVPDFVAPPYRFFSGNVEYWRTLMGRGVGYYDPNTIKIGKTLYWTKALGDVGNFEGVRHNFLEPGQRPTIYAGPTVTSSEVNGLELRNLRVQGTVAFDAATRSLFTNAGAPDQDDTPMFTNFMPGDIINVASPLNTGQYTITDTPTDGLGHTIFVKEPVVNETATTTMTIEGWAGPFAVCGTNSKVRSIAIDQELQNGLYFADDKGKLKDFSVAWEYQAQAIDSTGNPTGDWFSLGTGTYTMHTNTTQRRTVEWDVAEDRYHVRGRRTSIKKFEARFANTLVWTGLKGVIPHSGVYPHSSLLEMEMQATNAMAASASRQVSIVQTRLLPHYDPITKSWGPLIPTRSIAAAVSDALKQAKNPVSYGAGKRDDEIDLDTLWGELYPLWETRGDHFDGVLDSVQPIWDVVNSITKAGRTAALQVGGIITFVRDQAQDLPKGMFGNKRIRRNTFSANHILVDANTRDDVIVEYWDRTNWSRREVRCTPEGSLSQKPERISVFGVTDRAHAWREGIYQAASNRWRREFCSFSAGMVAQLLLRGDQCLVSSDIPQWSQQGDILLVDGNTITLSDPMVWGSDTHYLWIASKSNEPWGPVIVTRGGRDDVVILDATSKANIELAQGPLEDLWVTEDDEIDAPTGFMFGSGLESFQRMKVIGGKSRSTEEIELTFVRDDDRVHLADQGTPPADVDPDVSPAPLPGTVQMVGINATVASGVDPVNLNVTWPHNGGALSYRLQYSYDQSGWTDFYNSTGLSTTLTVLAGVTYIRGAVTNAVGEGPWSLTFAGNFGVAGTLPGIPGSVNVEADPAGGTLSATWTAALRATSYLAEILVESVVNSGTFDTPVLSTFTTTTSTLWSVADITAAGGPWKNVRLRVFGINTAGTGAAGTDTLTGILLDESAAELKTTGIDLVRDLITHGRINLVGDDPTFWSSVDGTTFIKSFHINKTTGKLTFDQAPAGNIVTSVAGRTGDITLVVADITNAGTMALQNANNVNITGGTGVFDNLTLVNDLFPVVSVALLNTNTSGGRMEFILQAGSGVDTVTGRFTAQPGGAFYFTTVSAHPIIYGANNLDAVDFQIDGTTRFRYGVTLDVALTVPMGGTGATTAAGARTNLGVVGTAGGTMTDNLTFSVDQKGLVFSGGGQLHDLNGTATILRAENDNFRVYDETQTNILLDVRPTVFQYKGNNIYYVGTSIIVPTANGGTGSSSTSGARTNLGLAIGSDVQAYNGELAALAANTTNGLWTRTGAGTGSARTITGTANHIVVTDGNGVGGNPTIDLHSSVIAALGASGLPTAGGTMTGNITFADNNEGIIFSGGTTMYDANGTAFIIQAENDIFKVFNEAGSTVILDARADGTLNILGNYVYRAGGTDIPVPDGGTGVGTHTNHGVLLGQGTSALVATAAMTNGELLVGQTGADPLPKTVSGDATMAASGALTVASIGGKAVTLGGALTFSGAFSFTGTLTNTTTVTFPTTGTLATLSNKLSDFAATTSAELRAVLTNETGGGLAVFNDTPQILTPDINGGTVDSLTSLSIKTTGTGLFDLTFAVTEAMSNNRILTFKTNDAARTLDFGGNLTLAGSFTTSGAFSSTFTMTGTTTVTFPQTGTLATLSNKLSAFAATTSAEMRSVISDETGGGLAVFNDTATLLTPVLTTPDINGGTADALTSLSIRSTAVAFDMLLANAETLTANRTLTIKLNDAARTLDIGGNVTFGAGGTVAYVANKLSVFAATSSAEMRSVISDETGGGLAVFNDTPQILTPDINGGTADSLTSLSIRSTGTGAFDLTVANTENLTAGRTLTVKMNDAARTLDLAGNLTLAGAFVTAGAFSMTLTASAATNVTLPTTGTLATLAGSETFTNKTLTSPVISGGSANNMTLGATTASTIKGTTIDASTGFYLSGNQALVASGGGHGFRDTGAAVNNVLVTTTQNTYNNDTHRWNVRAGTILGQMDATGLGVGKAPSDKLDVGGRIRTDVTLTTGAKAQARYFPMNINGTVVNVLTD